MISPENILRLTAHRNPVASVVADLASAILTVRDVNGNGRKANSREYVNESK